MDGRIVAIGLALVVTAAGFGTMFVMLKPVDTVSDFSIIDKLMEEEIDDGLHYGYSCYSDNYKRVLKMDVTDASHYIISRSDEIAMNGSQTTFTNTEFSDLFFVFAEPTEWPAWVTYEVEELVPGTDLYTLNGSGKIQESMIVESKDLDVEFEDLCITYNTEYDIFTCVTGELSFSGTSTLQIPYITTPLDYKIEYNEVRYEFAEDAEEGYVVKGYGNINESGGKIYDSVEELVSDNMVGYTPGIAVTKSEEVLYASVGCYRYTLDGKERGSEYSNYYKTVHEGFLVKGEGTQNGLSTRESVELYYV